MSARSKAIVALLGTSLFAVGPLFPQTPPANDVRSKLSRLEDVELRLTRMMSNGKPTDLPRNSGITLTFRKGGQIGGRSAINNYGGVFSVMPDGHITIQLTVVTQMAGAPEMMELERKYLDALSEAKQISVEPDRVTLASDTMSMEFAIGRQK